MAEATDELHIPSEHETSHEIYKLCANTSFGRRLRSLSSRQAHHKDKFVSPYELGEGKVKGDGNKASWDFELRNKLYPEVEFVLRLDVIVGGIVRLRVDEVRSKTGHKRYDGAAGYVLDGEPQVESLSNINYSSENNSTTINIFESKSIHITHSPLSLTFKHNDKTAAVINDRSLFHMEHYRTRQDGAKVDTEKEWFMGKQDPEEWVESFRGYTEQNTKGPEGYSLDVTFPSANHVYGLGEKAAPLSLPSTDGSYFEDPYRVYNIDYVMYDASSSTGLYGTVPFLQSHVPGVSTGFLTLMSSEGWIDVVHPEEGGVQTHWFGESGVLDSFIMLGSQPKEIFKQYADLTGYSPLPPLFAIGHHQCRWNYNDQEDVLTVNKKFDEAGIPYDVIWLDVDWTDRKRYFEWDKEQFPKPMEMIKELAESGRQLVTIIDPHLSSHDDYPIFKEAKQKGILVKEPTGKSEYIGHCWPGASSWVDFLHPESNEWWGDLYDFQKFTESTPNVWIWNDMNEPAVFEGPEKTMSKNNLHYGGVEHRDVHNMYGMLLQKSTYEGLLRREEEKKRPFVLSRSFFAGSQRYGAVWTGDNVGSWDHLAGQTAMILGCAATGISFVGSDTGGFFYNPKPELLARWYQAGNVSPFFRAHACNDTERREPYLYDGEIGKVIKDAISLRYVMMPVWYTEFWRTSQSGVPVMRALYVEHPEDEGGFAIGDQFYIGQSGILSKPVTAAGVAETEVYLPPNETYYDYYSNNVFPSEKAGRNVTVDTPLAHSVLLIRGGSIVPLHEDRGRSTHGALKLDVTLLITPGADGKASGEIYLDDTTTFAFEKGEFAVRQFTFDGKTLSSKRAGGSGFSSGAKVVKVRVLGESGAESSHTLKLDEDWEVSL